MAMKASKVHKNMFCFEEAMCKEEETSSRKFFTPFYLLFGNMCY